MGAVRILVLTHDLSDAATEKRVLMLRAGGADVKVAGFRRTHDAPREVAGRPAIDFGLTYGGGFLQRIWSVLRETALLGRYRDLFSDTDVIIARNLENLAIAARGRNFAPPPGPVLVYECLDIHRFLLNRGPLGAAVRALEGWLARRASAVITSSPAFVENYYETLSRVRAPVSLIENKVFDAGGPVKTELPPRPPGPPWIIGWFGMIRCRKSLRILSDLARQSGGAVEIVIRGRPAPDLFPDFEKEIAGLPGVKFLGPYSPGDLASIYRSVHFTWAIDIFEEGLNSSWLLPNRLYEGGAFGAVPIALEEVETGRFLQRLGIGVTLRQPLADSLTNYFKNLTQASYTALESASSRVPRAVWAYGPTDCKLLVHYLQSLEQAA